MNSFIDFIISMNSFINFIINSINMNIFISFISFISFIINIIFINMNIFTYIFISFIISIIFSNMNTNIVITVYLNISTIFMVIVIITGILAITFNNRFSDTFTNVNRSPSTLHIWFNVSIINFSNFIAFHNSISFSNISTGRGIQFRRNYFCLRKKHTTLHFYLINHAAD